MTVVPRARPDQAMNVLMITSLLPHRTAVKGGAIVMHGQLMTLASRHHVTLATLADDDPVQHEAAQQLQASGIETHCIWRPPSTGVRLWTRRMRLAQQWLRRTDPLRTLAFSSPPMQNLLDRLFRTHHFDLVQVEDNAMGSYAYPAGIPTVLTEHEVRTDADVTAAASNRSWMTQGANRIEKRRWSSYQAAVWQRFDRIQVFTPGDAAAVRAVIPDRADHVRVNPFGIDLPPAVANDQERPDTVAFIGGFLHPPNVDAALWLGHTIMPLLRTHAPGVRLLIVGSDPPRSVRQLACADITVTGRVPAIEPFMAQAAVILAPLRTGGGMRLKVLQAMAAGKAVVTTTPGTAGLAHREALPLLVADDAEGLAHAAAEVLTRDTLRQDVGRRARDFVAKEYSWAAYGRRLDATYAELIPSKLKDDERPSADFPGVQP